MQTATDSHSLLTPDGEEYSGEVVLDAKGKAKGTLSVCCGRCGGSGRWKRRRDCFSCAGAGSKDKPIRLYTAPEFAKFERDRDRRVDAKVRQEEERARRLAESYLAFREGHGDLFDRAERVPNAFLEDLMAKAREWGSLTDPQVAAMRRTVAEREAAHALYGASSHVGSEGDKLTVEVTCHRSASFMGRKFGRRGKPRTVHVSEMRDAAGNAYLAISQAFALAEGERATVTGTVKKHEDDKGWAVTVLTRCAATDRRAAFVARAPVGESSGPAATAHDPDDFLEDGHVPSMGM